MNVPVDRSYSGVAVPITLHHVLFSLHTVVLSSYTCATDGASVCDAVVLLAKL